jgi:DNA polymerase elongation subunit (family B)
VKSRTGTSKGSAETSGLSCVNAWWDGNDVIAKMRDAEGRDTFIRKPARYVHFLKASDIDATLERRFKESRHIAGMVRDGSWWRVTWRDWKTLRAAAGPKGYFESQGVQTYEADVSPVTRWLVESGVPIAKPRRVYLDLELDTRCTIEQMVRGKARILTWSLVDHDTGEAVSGVLEEDSDESEIEMLKDLWFELKHWDQIAAWNGDEFDFPVLTERSYVLGLKVQKKRWLWIDQLAIFRRLNSMASESGDEKQSLALDNVAKTLLGEGKSPLESAKAFDYWVAGGDSRKQLASYNVRDSQLCRMIEQKTGYLALNQTVCEACGVLPNTSGANPTKFVESYLMRLARTRDVRFKSHYAFDQEFDAFKGAYVMEPTKTGIIEDVHVCDFASLYPSIILSWNISPETYMPDVKLVEDELSRPAYLRGQPLRRFPRPANTSEAPLTHAVFSTESIGILPLALTNILGLRSYWSDLKASIAPGTPEWVDADRNASGYKVMANSFYGVMGSPFSRFYERMVAESVSTTGEWLIRAVISAAEERGYQGFYGDTDSAFVDKVSRADFAAFVDWCNCDLFPKLLEGQGCRENRIKLAYEKQFSVLIMVSKKRYAGRFAHYKGKDATENSKPEIKGLEYKRGDTARLAREMQRDLIESVLYKGVRDVEVLAAMVESWKERILEGDLDIEDITISKKLTKPIEEYKQRATKNGTTPLPAHVAIAKSRNAKGAQLRPGARISYVVTDASVSPMKVIPIEEFVGEFDRFYLWESLVYPASMRVLESAFPGSRWKNYFKARPKAVRVAKVADATKAVAPSKRRKLIEGQSELFRTNIVGGK